jgi:hypothetical protein
LLLFLSAALTGRQDGADIVQRGPVDPLVALAGVVATPGFELLQEANHAGRAEFAAEGFRAALADFVERLFHVASRRAIRESWRFGP